MSTSSVDRSLVRTQLPTDRSHEGAQAPSCLAKSGFDGIRSPTYFFFSSRRRHTRSVSAFLLNRSSDLLRLFVFRLLRLKRFSTLTLKVLCNIGISQSTFSVKVLNLFSRSRRKTNKRKSKHSAMLRNKETRHRMFIGLR